MKKFLALFLTLCMLLALAPCGALAAAEGNAGPAGGYKLRAVTGGAGSDLEIVSAVLDLGVDFYLVLGRDGSGCMRFLEAEIPLSWDDDSLIIQPTGQNRRILELPYTFADGTLSISTPAYSMDFRAMSDAELADYETNGPGSLNGMIAALAQSLIGSMDADLVDSLLFSLAMGVMDGGTTPIPEGEPSTEPVTGTVDGLKITVLGAEHVQDGELGDLILFYFDVTNESDMVRAVWTYELDAAQGGEFLEPEYEKDVVPEAYNINLSFLPGKTIRCAAAYFFDPEGGTVGFRFSSHGGESSVLCYADPQNLSGAPAEPFAFDAEPASYALYEELPEETEIVGIGRTEFFTDEDGNDALRYELRAPEFSEEDEGSIYYYCDVFQDGVELPWLWDDPGFEDAEDGTFRSFACHVRTDSPVLIVINKEVDIGEGVAVAAKFVEKPLPYDAVAYEAAAQAVRDEYIQVTQDGIDNFDEEAHPEMPWYTAVLTRHAENRYYEWFYDFDGNGVPEMLVAVGNDDYRTTVAVYAFDGESMRYLCREHPLGERSHLSYAGGLFVVHGSGGAASGILAVYRIAEDGWSTDLVDVIDYEYSDAEHVTYTSHSGAISAEEVESLGLADYERFDAEEPVWTCFYPETAA